RVRGSLEKLIQRPRVAVGRVEVAPIVEAQAEGVDLAVREMLDARAVELDAIRVPRRHADLVCRLALDVRRVGKTVAAVDPAVEPPDELSGHGVRVLEAILRKEDLALVGLAVAVRVGHQVEIRDAVDEGLRALVDREDANWDVEIVGESGDFA